MWIFFGVGGGGRGRFHVFAIEKARMKFSTAFYVGLTDLSVAFSL